MDDNNNPLRKFLQNMDPEKNWPDNYRESPIFIKGHQAGYMKGLHAAWKEADTVIDSVRNIIELHDRRMCKDEFEE